jgi:putative zinc finger/helix-turn-helix YgiT family protein
MLKKEKGGIIMKDMLIEKNKIECPICGNFHFVEKRIRKTQALFKKEVVDYDEIYFVCKESNEEENEFVPAKVLDLNLLKVRNAFRVSKGLLTSNEISTIRLYYDLTQSEFAAMLGWGKITVTRYESKTVQDETYDTIMRMVYKNSIIFMC